MRSNHRTCSLVLATALANFASASAVSQDSSVLAQAKVLEARGDVARAASVLRAAIDRADERTRPALEKQLTRLVALEAFGMKPEVDVATEAQGSGQDPVDRLIGVLNTGNDTPEVRSAIQQLRILGDLVVPHLLRAFPNLGPFGVMNALSVMRRTTDPRVGTFLAGQIKTAAPEVVTAIVRQLDDLSEKVAMTVVAEMLGGDVSEQQRLAAFRVYLKYQPKAETCLGLRKQLVASPSVNTRYWTALLAIQSDAMNEDEVLRVAKTLTDAQVAEMARDVKKPSWVRLGLLGFPKPGQRNGVSDFLEKFEWWQAPEAAAPLLLDVRSAGHQVKEELREMIRRGWRVPAELDEAFWKFAEADGHDAWRLYMAALPEDAEDRGIRAWQQNPLRRVEIIDGLHRTERAWTQLAVMDLLAAETPFRYAKFSFNFDWEKATPAAIEGLVKFARKWPVVSPADSGSWALGLVHAYSEWSVLPIAVVEPLFASGHPLAWGAVHQRNPELMLSLARKVEALPSKMVSYLAGHLRRHGTVADLPTAMRIMRTMKAPSGTYRMVSDFFGRMAKGNIDVLALAAEPSALHPGALQYTDRWAREVAAGVHVRDLPALLKVLPKLRHGVALVVCETLGEQVEAVHVEALATALRACYGSKWGDTRGHSDERGPIGNRTLAIALINLLGQTKSEAALPHLRQVFEDTKLSSTMTRSAARAALHAAGASRVSLLKQMLQSKQEEVVVAAVQVEDLRTSEELRQLAFAGVLRFATEANDSKDIFDVLGKDAQLELALKVINDKQMPSFHRELCSQALWLLAERKDARYLPQLILGASHRSQYTRATAAQMLGRTFSLEAVDPLLELLKDDEKQVREAAQLSLDKIANYLDEREKWEKRFGKDKK